MTERGYPRNYGEVFTIHHPPLTFTNYQSETASPQIATLSLATGGLAVMSVYRYFWALHKVTKNAYKITSFKG
ncbi:hypothetical protein JCM13991_01010 [Thermodesulfovibrio hydrogeniphilus]